MLLCEIATGARNNKHDAIYDYNILLFDLYYREIGMEYHEL